MIAFVCGDDKQRVVLVDSVSRQPREELAEGLVVRLCLRVMAYVAGPKTTLLGVREADRRCMRVFPGGIIVDVGNVGIGDLHAVLLHGCHVGQRLGSVDSAETRESGIRRSAVVRDQVAVQIVQRAMRADHWSNEFVAI